MEMNSGNKKRIILSLLKLLIIAVIAVTKNRFEGGGNANRNVITSILHKLWGSPITGRRNDQISAVFNTYHN